MKILDVAEFYARLGGGVRTYVEQKFLAADKFGHHLTVVAPGPSNEIEYRTGGKLIWVKSPVIPVDRRYHLFWNQSAIDKIVMLEQPDFIEGSSPWRGAWFAGRQSSSIAKALVIHQDPVLTYPHTLFNGFIHKNTIDKSFKWFYRYWMNLQSLYDTSIVASPWLSNRLESMGMQKPEVIRFGIDKQAYSPAFRDEALRMQMLNACRVESPNARLIISIGRFHPEKRMQFLIHAFKQATKQAPLALYILGDGPMRKQMRHLAKDTPGVYLGGHVDDRKQIASALASADFYLHACPTETFGMVIAEAACSGLPQVVPNSGGAADIARLVDCAEYFPPDDINGCVAAISRLLARNDVMLRHTVAERTDRIPDISDHFMNLFNHYENILANR